MNTNYMIHIAAKCSDGKVHSMTYDIDDEEINSISWLCTMFNYTKEVFPDVHFCIQKSMLLMIIF